MIQLNHALLVELGLGSLPPAVQNDLLAHMYAVLEGRVGRVLAERMSDGQLDEFEGFIDAGDDDGATAWLRTNMPDYQDVVRVQFELLTDEVRRDRDAIIAAV